MKEIDQRTTARNNHQHLSSHILSSRINTSQIWHLEDEYPQDPIQHGGMLSN